MASARMPFPEGETDPALLFPVRLQNSIQSVPRFPPQYHAQEKEYEPPQKTLAPPCRCVRHQPLRRINLRLVGLCAAPCRAPLPHHRHCRHGRKPRRSLQSRQRHCPHSDDSRGLDQRSLRTPRHHSRRRHCDGARLLPSRHGRDAARTHPRLRAGVRPGTRARLWVERQHHAQILPRPQRTCRRHRHGGLWAELRDPSSRRACAH